MRGRPDDVDKTICVVDAESVSHIAGTCTEPRPLNGSRILEAIQRLQAEGLKIILVSQQDMPPLMFDSVDSSAFLYIKSLNGSAIDTIRTAADYRCYFLTSADAAAFESDWRLPQKHQMWLHQNPDMQVKFTFSLEFLPLFSTSDPSQTCPNMHEECDQTEMVGSEQGVLETLPSGWISDSLTPLMAVLPCPADDASHPILAIQAQDEKDSIVQHAVSLSQTHIYSGTEEKELREWRKDIKGPWSHDHISSHLVHVAGGRNPLRAVGAGGRKLARRRAAHLALVVAYYASKSTPAVWNIGPKDNHELNCLVQRAKKLIANARSLKQSTGTLTGSAIDEEPCSLIEISEDFSFTSKATEWLGDPSAECKNPPAPSLEHLHGQLKNQVVVAFKAYFGETGTGYLNLAPGDKVQLLHENIEAPDSGDTHAGYVFGRLIGSTAPAADQEGWLPTDVVRLER